MNAKLPGIVFREVHAPAIELEPERYSSSASNARMCLAGGGRCFVGLSGDEVVLRMWTMVLDEAGTDRLAPASSAFGPTAFVHDCWTSPDHRGRSIYPAGLRWLIAELGASGIRQLIMTITSGNTSAIRGCEKAGFSQAAVFHVSGRSLGTRSRQRSARGEESDRAVPSEESSPAAGSSTTDRALAPRALLELLSDVIAVRRTAWIVGTGHSMFPTLRDGDAVLLGPLDSLSQGDVVLFAHLGLPVVHRVIEKKGTRLRTRGDAARRPDAWIEERDVIAVALATAPYIRDPGAQEGFRLIARGESQTRLGPVTPLTTTLRFGARAFGRFVVARGLLAARRTLLLLRWKPRRTSRRPSRSIRGRE